jgi:Lrp/AsnC family leucine-responsive transcriptional regulator
VDLGLLARLSRDGRASWVDLAAEFGLTPPAIAARVRRLVETGAIRQFAAWVSPETLGCVTAIVGISFPGAEGHVEFRQAVSRLLAVQECHRVAGGAQYVLKVRTRSAAELENLLSTVLPRVALGASITASMVLQTIKESPNFPIPTRT